MRLKLEAIYDTPNGQMIEMTLWQQVGMGNPNGYPIPGETGLWKIQSVANPSRDISGLMTPSVDTTTKYLRNPVTRDYDAIVSPVSMDPLPAYYDYFSLPLKPGWVLVP